MEEFINHLCEKFGIDKEKAAGIASHLQTQGHDLPSLLQGGFSMEKLQGLLAGNSQLLESIPGVGGMLGGLLGGGNQAVADVPTEVPDLPKLPG